MKVLFCPVLPGLLKSIALWKVSRPRPFVLLVRALCRQVEYETEMDFKGEKQPDLCLNI